MDFRKQTGVLLQKTRWLDPSAGSVLASFLVPSAYPSQEGLRIHSTAPCISPSPFVPRDEGCSVIDREGHAVIKGSDGPHRAAAAWIW